MLEVGTKAPDFTLPDQGGDGCGILFKKGEIIRKVREEDLVEELLKEIESM